MFVGEADGIVEEGAGGHQGGGGESTRRVQFDDGAVHARGEPEVVGVNKEHQEQGIGGWGSRCSAVDGRVKGRVVVHLELAVDFEAAAAGHDVGPELIQAGDEVLALLGEEGESLAIAIRVARRGVASVDLFLGMEDLEGKDRETVDDEAGRFGVQGSGGGLATLRSEDRRSMVQQENVALLGEIVAALVVAVDGALDLGDLGIGGARVASAILGMPEVEVGAVLVQNRVHEVLGMNVVGVVIAVPEAGGAVVETGDFDGREVERIGHGAHSGATRLW